MQIIGVMYIIGAFISAIVGTFLSWVIRTELEVTSGNNIWVLNLELYNVDFSLHGLIMIFFLIMPVLLGGVGNIMMVLLIGWPEVWYPRMNNLALVLTGIWFFMLMEWFIIEEVNGVGWTLYPPLSTSSFTLSSNGLWMLLGSLLVTGIAWTIATGNLTSTLQNMRIDSLIVTINMTIVHTFYITFILLILALPVLTVGLLVVMMDLNCGSWFFDSANGGDAVLFQHIFWFFGHPEVYILILPGFGCITYALLMNRNNVDGIQTLFLATVSIAILGLIVWAHHMFTWDMDIDTRIYFTAVTMAIAIPTGTKVFTWYIMIRFDGQVGHGFTFVFTLEMTVIALLLFIIGGTTGVILGNGCIDDSLHDTYYVVGHFHIVLGLVLMLVIRMFVPETCLDINGLSWFIGFNLLVHNVAVFMWFLVVLAVFIIMHWMGFLPHPRRIPDYVESQVNTMISYLIHAVVILVLLTINMGCAM